MLKSPSSQVWKRVATLSRLNVDFPCEAETTEPAPLQGAQTTEPGSQGSDTGFAESVPEESWNTTNSTREGMHAGLIFRGINTAGAAP